MARIAKRDLTRQQQLARGPVDLPFLALVLILLGIGLVMLLSASSYAASMSKASNYDATFYFKRQAAFAVMGVIVMYVVSKFDYQRWRGLSPSFWGAAILLLIAVLIPGWASPQQRYPVAENRHRVPALGGGQDRRGAVLRRQPVQAGPIPKSCPRGDIGSRSRACGNSGTGPTSTTSGTCWRCCCLWAC